MTTEWTDLTTLQDVAKAQADGWEIGVRWDEDDRWVSWGGQVWQDDMKYRARPRQLKMKKVKMLCWFDGFALFWRKESMNLDKQWIRIPAQDIEIEILEGV